MLGGWEPHKNQDGRVVDTHLLSLTDAGVGTVHSEFTIHNPSQQTPVSPSLRASSDGGSSACPGGDECV